VGHRSFDLPIGCAARRSTIRPVEDSVVKLLLVGTLVCSALAGSGESRRPAPPAKIHRSVDQVLAERGGPAHVWVFFEDKGPGDTARAIRDLEQTYDPRAIQRRRLRRTAPGLFDERDLPVYGGYLDAVSETGATLGAASRWVNGATARATKTQVQAIAALPFVSKIQPVRRIGRPPLPDGPSAVDRPAGGAATGDFYGLAEEQLAQINVIALHQQGFTGQGVIIGVLDTGFSTTHEAFNYPGHPIQVVAARDFLDNDPNVGIEPGDHPEQHHHGTLILGTMGAYNPGVLVAGAYDAGFILAKVEDVEFEYPAEEHLFVAGLEFIEARGGDVATSSRADLGHDHRRQHGHRQRAPLPAGGGQPGSRQRSGDVIAAASIGRLPGYRLRVRG
jgi:hypothetical protein